MKKPKISILMPLYNTPPSLLRNAIKSHLNQSQKNFELLILNDSPNNSALAQVVSEFDDPRIVYRKNESHLGLAGARNKLIEMARGKYLAVADHDDVSMPDRLKLQSQYLDWHPWCGVCSAQRTQVFSNDEKIASHFPTSNRGMKKDIGKISHCACMLRKSVLDRHKIIYDDAVFPHEDSKLFRDLAKITCFHAIDKVLVHWIFHGDNTSILCGVKYERKQKEKS